jgi:hypothetical protein
MVEGAPATIGGGSERGPARYDRMIHSLVFRSLVADAVAFGLFPAGDWRSPFWPYPRSGFYTHFPRRQAKIL